MGRHHKPIDPNGPLAEFAGGLRALKLASKLTYKQMSCMVAYCVSVLSNAAAGGTRLPTLAVTLAYVRACGGCEDEWPERWERARRNLGGDADGDRRG
jgi:hypothetical protein